MSTATVEARNGSPFGDVLPGMPLLGEVITWGCPGVAIRHADLVAALRESGLDESVARELAPRHAFSRACKKLGEQRIIRQVAEDATAITFQFTRESRASDTYEYTLETLLTLEKATGKVSCPLPGLASLAQEELDRCVEARNGSDVTRVVQKLFERSADLFPIRQRGGVYFVPQRHARFVDRVERLLRALNGSLRRFPVPAGTPQGDRSVKEAVAAGIEALIEEQEQAVEAFGADTRADTLQRAAERVRNVRFKLESYAELLAEERSRLERGLAEAARRLREKVEAIAPSAAPS